jgi:hypothetical protein
MDEDELALMAAYGDDPEMFQAMLESMRQAKIDSLQIMPEPPADADAAAVCTV